MTPHVIDGHHRMAADARGAEIVIKHIETYLCPSILSVDLTRVVAGSDGPIAPGRVPAK